MFLLVRDEDVPTVAAAITASATEANLEPVDLAEGAEDPIAMLAVLTGPRVFVSMNDDQVFVSGLESLDISEADEWGSAISAACETEVVAMDVAEDGVRVWVFDGGELDEEIEVPLDPKGRTRAPRLIELTSSEEGRRELENGIAAARPDDLAQGILRCLQAEQNENAQMLAFRDPLDEGGEAEAEPAIIVSALPGAGLEGRIGSPVRSPNGNAFAVTLAGVDSIEGLRLELSGDALDLVSVDALDVLVRVRGAHELVHRVLRPAAAAGGAIVLEIPDAFIECVELGPPQLDATDLFASMQRIMSAGDQALLNTLTIRPSGMGLRAGDAELVLRASPLRAASTPGGIRSGEATIPVRIV